MAKTQAESDLSKPEEMFAWIFAAGVPDPRGENYPNQPLIPPPCWPAFSKMLYEFGCRFDPELQQRWVSPARGPLGPFTAAGSTDVKPDDIADFVADQFPQVAERVRNVQPDKQQEALREQAEMLLDSISRLDQARARLEAQVASEAQSEED